MSGSRRIGNKSNKASSSRESVAFGAGDNLDSTFGSEDEQLLRGMFSMLSVA
eukprot:CAMPEP_0202089348 /NCGR_PEP_ID=MMETSP0964-20121228/40878_1 /ASSEMBLY_ACC=CAM_ASM_000500 /TAXON_ID=4773 /ORGANISM="Schizochytrium aggregatum, Strain ATCC28209" /LENGTH=51 /DNA_ID=CAMNT_0048657419 /DNA_START=8 /DNA_END=159 /DNA_ORIENTATION=-